MAGGAASAARCGGNRAAGQHSSVWGGCRALPGRPALSQCAACSQAIEAQLTICLGLCPCCSYRRETVLRLYLVRLCCAANTGGPGHAVYTYFSSRQRRGNSNSQNCPEMVHSGGGQISDALSWHCLQTDPSPVRKAASSPQASVRQRATALLTLLGAEAPAGAHGGAAPPAGAADLMGGLDEPSAASAGPDLMGEQQIPIQYPVAAF